MTCHLEKKKKKNRIHSYNNTRFNSLILGTYGPNEGLSFILKMGPLSNNFPCLTQFGQKLDLGRFYIQLFNFESDFLSI